MKGSLLISVLWHAGMALGATEKQSEGKGRPFPEEIGIPEAVAVPDDGLSLFPQGGGGPPGRCGPNCDICRFSFCVRCLPGFELAAGNCVMVLDFDDIIVSDPFNGFFQIPNGYRGFDYSDNFVGVDHFLVFDDGFFYGLRSGSFTATNFFGDPASIMAPPGTTFSVLSLSISAAACSPLIVSFRGEKPNGRNVFFSTVLTFEPFIPATHPTDINLLTKGFNNIVTFEIITSDHPTPVCPYDLSPGQFDDYVSIDDIRVL